MMLVGATAGALGLAWPQAAQAFNLYQDNGIEINLDTTLEYANFYRVNDPSAFLTNNANGDEGDLRTRLKAPAMTLTQELYVSDELKTGRVMVKDEDVCLHCGLCAERCPTGAWDMQKFLLDITRAGGACSV